ncbi:MULTISPECIES: serine protease [unclassified Photobacterium]|uniref:S1 family peptidase n=1 Tax=unclassified Photobacterium TaxID=2628852 RepID=UPI001EDF87A9|nr:MULTISPECIES: serine protease [unclassified Photobacterium]MCG3862575.1 serine protease [Photobacterium sp. Ph6]MCG3874106.1 serine protease [Photobacterium sp. Ph5]
MNKIKTLGLAIAGIVSFPLSATASESDISAYIIGGNEVQTNPEELSTVYIQAGTWECTGSLIAKRWVLTAAHCIRTGSQNASLQTIPTEDIKIYAGVTGRSDFEPNNTYQAVEVIVHPDYLPEGTVLVEGTSETQLKTPYVNDIALIAVSRNVDNGIIVSLPTEQEAFTIESEISDSNQKLIAQGWGLTSNSVTFGSDVLMETELSYFPTNECYNKMLASNGSWLSSGVDTLKLCTLEQSSVGVCRGDSGGPLYYERADGSKIQLGITSFGTIECAIGLPDVYTRVGGYDDWISNVITEKTPTLPAPVPFEDESTDKDNTNNTDSGGGGGSVGVSFVMSLLAMGWLRRKRS